MRFVFAILVTAVATTAFATAAAAQPAPPTIDTLQVVVWPEYDRPDALVIYRVTLDAATPMPAQVTVRVPAAVGKPHAVAKRGASGGLYVAEHTYAVDGEWANIIITTDNPSVQLEYYAPLQVEAGVRRFTFQWPGGPAVKSLTYELQEPIGAADFTVSPAPAQRAVRNDGLNYSEGIVAGREPTAAGTFEFSYKRDSTQLTSEILRQRQPQQATPQQPPAGLPPAQAPGLPTPRQPGAGKTTDKGGMSWGLIALFIAAAFGAGIFVGRASIADDEEADSDS